jgi:integrase
MTSDSSEEIRFRTKRFYLAVFRQRYNGKYSRSWYYRQMVAGKTYSFPLGVDKREAAKKAEQVFAFLQDPNNTIQDAIEEFNEKKKLRLDAAKEMADKPSTIDEVLKVYEAERKRWGLSESTVRGNRVKLLTGIRRADAYTRGEPFVSRSGAKIDYSKILSRPVAGVLTAKMAYALQNGLLNEAEDEEELVTATVTANSYLRSIRSIFAEDQFSYYLNLGLNLPDRDEWPFLKVRPLRGGKKRRKLPPIPVVTKILESGSELKKKDLDAYRAYLLALHCSGRRKEVVNAKWEWFRVDAGPIALEIPDTDQTFKVKWGRGRRVLVERWVYDALLETKGDSPYVLDLSDVAREQVTRHNRSCTALDTINAWLRAKGLDENKPFHTLRALWFSAKVKTDGLLAAQQQGGHQDPKTTSDSYADNELPDEQIEFWKPGWSKKLGTPKPTKFVAQ